MKQNLDAVPVVAPFITSIDVNKLPAQSRGLQRVLSTSFRVNNVFELIKAVGAARHGPTSIRRTVPQRAVGHGCRRLLYAGIASCDGFLPCASSWSLNFFSGVAYDDMKVAAISSGSTGSMHRHDAGRRADALRHELPGGQCRTKLDMTQVVGSGEGRLPGCNRRPSVPLQQALEHTDHPSGRWCPRSATAASSTRHRHHLSETRQFTVDPPRSAGSTRWASTTR